MLSIILCPLAMQLCKWYAPPESSKTRRHRPGPAPCPRPLETAALSRGQHRRYPNRRSPSRDARSHSGRRTRRDPTREMGPPTLWIRRHWRRVTGILRCTRRPATGSLWSVYSPVVCAPARYDVSVLWLTAGKVMRTALDTWGRHNLVEEATYVLLIFILWLRPISPGQNMDHVGPRADVAGRSR